MFIDKWKHRTGSLRNVPVVFYPFLPEQELVRCNLCEKKLRTPCLAIISQAPINSDLPCRDELSTFETNKADWIIDIFQLILQVSLFDQIQADDIAVCCIVHLAASWQVGRPLFSDRHQHWVEEGRFRVLAKYGGRERIWSTGVVVLIWPRVCGSRLARSRRRRLSLHRHSTKGQTELWIKR